ncbi:MAG: hypothetical protein M1826_004632 [Phylliscum demangeonii]|nr:MAG: hypothetical protein M1826_004632 [Phylliscum demangeonii]
MATSAIAFFGATGGCAAQALAQSLEAGYTCRARALLSTIAVARTPSKLTALLQSKHHLAPALLAQHLSVIEGNAKDIDAVTRTLLVSPPSSSSSSSSAAAVVDTIVFGIGAAPKLQLSLLRPVTVDDTTVCQDAARTILTALRQLSPAQPPVFIAISTTGLSPLRRDVPLPLVPLYQVLLAVPHHDKRAMELALLQDRGAAAAAATSTKTETETETTAASVLAGFVVVRASLLTDGAMRGTQKVRVGWEMEGPASAKTQLPAIGYTISRADVGNWIFETLLWPSPRADIGPHGRVVRGSAEWLDRMVTLTY